MLLYGLYNSFSMSYALMCRTTPFGKYHRSRADQPCFLLHGIMANEQNLKKFTSETAKENQPKSVESRYRNKIKKGLIADAILEELSADDLREIARGMIDRAKENSGDLVAMRDTIGEKPKTEVDATVKNEDMDKMDAILGELGMINE